MDRSLLLIFNHELTTSQKEDAIASLGVKEIIPMPDELKSIWCNIPPDADSIIEYIAPIKKWILQTALPDDFILIQGDFGACYLLVSYTFENGFIPVYSTTHRRAIEVKMADGGIQMTHQFLHQRFRRYVG